MTHHPDDLASVTAANRGRLMGVAAAISTITNSERHMNDLEDLEAKARATTQGEWSVEPHGSTRALYAGRNNERHGLRLLNLDDGDRNIAANAAYIVAAQPSVVLELIERVRAAEAKAGEPVAWLIEHPREGKSVELARLGTRPLFPADEEAGFTASPLYAAPPNVSALQERVKTLEKALGRAHNEAARMRDAYGFPGMQRLVELTAPVPASPMEPNVGVGGSNE